MASGDEERKVEGEEEEKEEQMMDDAAVDNVRTDEEEELLEEAKKEEEEEGKRGRGRGGRGGRRAITRRSPPVIRPLTMGTRMIPWKRTSRMGLTRSGQREGRRGAGHTAQRRRESGES